MQQMRSAVSWRAWPHADVLAWREGRAFSLPSTWVRYSALDTSFHRASYDWATTCAGTAPWSIRSTICSQAMLREICTLCPLCEVLMHGYNGECALR